MLPTTWLTLASQRLVTTRVVLRTTSTVPLTRTRTRSWSRHAHVAKYALGALEAHLALQSSRGGAGEPYSFRKWTRGLMTWQHRARWVGILGGARVVGRVPSSCMAVRCTRGIRMAMTVQKLVNRHDEWTLHFMVQSGPSDHKNSAIQWLRRIRPSGAPVPEMSHTCSMRHFNLYK